MTSIPERVPRQLEQSFYASRPTRFTVFLRTFLPWQAWRFVRINMRMFRAIAKSRH